MPDKVNVGTAYVSIVPVLDKSALSSLSRQLGGVSTDKAGAKIGSGLGKSISANLDLSSFGDVLVKAGDGLSKVGDTLTSHVTAPLVAAGAAAGAFALHTASAAETTQVSFTTMLGSEQAALEMMETLADFAAHTPFELSGLQTATRQLLAYGFTAEDVIPMLTAVGDATAALGTGQAGIEGVTRALGQMQTRGKVSAEEMLQLTEQGIPAWEYLAEAIGTDTAGAMDQVSKGAVDATTGIKALTDGMERDFGGMMEEQSKTVEGLFSNLSDAIEQPLMKLRDTGAYDRFAGALEDVVDAAGPFVESLLPHMEDALDVVADVLDVAAGAMESFSRSGRDSQDGIVGLVEQVVVLGPALKVLGPAVSALGTAMKTAGSAASLLKGGLVGLGIAAAAFVAIGFVQDLHEAEEHERLLADATRDVSDIMAEAGATAAASGQSISDSVAETADNAEEALRSLADLNDQASDTLGDLYAQEGMLDQYISTIEQLAGQSDLTATEQAKLKEAVEGYNEITGDSVSITDASNGMLSTSTEQLQTNAAAWRQNAEAQAYQQLATQYLEDQLQAEYDLQKAQQDLADATQNYYDLLDSGADLSTIMSALGDIGEAQQSVDELTASVDSAGDAYEELSAQAILATSNLDQAVKDTISGLPATAQAAGIDAANALASGIQSGTVSSEDATRFLISGVGGVLGELSPEMADRGGEAAVSLANAISAGQITVDQATQILTAAVSGEVSSLPAELQSYGWGAASALGYSLGGGSGLVSEGAYRDYLSATDAVSPLVDYYGYTGASSGDALSQSLSGKAVDVSASSSSLADSARNGVSGLPSDMGVTGASSGDSLARDMASKVGLVSSSSSSLMSAAQGGVSGLPSAMGGTASSSSRSFASGLSAFQMEAKRAANVMASQAALMGSGDSKQWGSHLSQNFASGISSGTNLVADAARRVAQAARGALGFSVPKEGPWSGSERGGETSGRHLVENFATGMVSAIPAIRAASMEVMGAATLSGADAPISVTSSPASSREGRDEATYLLARAVQLLSDIYGAMPEGMDARSFGRAVRRGVAYGY